MEIEMHRWDKYFLRDYVLSETNIVGEAITFEENKPTVNTELKNKRSWLHYQLKGRET